MRLPGFTADVSICSVSESYRADWSGEKAEEAIYPEQYLGQYPTQSPEGIVSGVRQRICVPIEEIGYVMDQYGHIHEYYTGRYKLVCP